MTAISTAAPTCRSGCATSRSMVDLDVRLPHDGAVRRLRAGAQPGGAADRSAGRRRRRAGDWRALANDGMAEIVAPHPDRFPGFIASMPMNNVDAALARSIARSPTSAPSASRSSPTSTGGRSTTRVRPDLRAHGGRRPADLAAPDADRQRVPTTRPRRSRSSRCGGRSAGPTRRASPWRGMVFAGYFDRCPNLKIITHHMGGMIPYFAGRIGPGLDQLGVAHRERRPDGAPEAAEEAAVRLLQDVLRRYGAVRRARAMQCGLAFFGADQVLFASDMPVRPGEGHVQHPRDDQGHRRPGRSPTATARRSTKATLAGC